VQIETILYMLNTTLGLVQWLSFDYSIDKKPTLQLILNLWDEEDYDQAAHQSNKE
jgi:hypothetical protein